jgi:hypothetical protein
MLRHVEKGDRIGRKTSFLARGREKGSTKERRK